jgi:hypothetical protein
VQRLVVALGVVAALTAALAVASSAARPAAGVPDVVRWWPLVVGLAVLAVAVVVAVVTLAQVRPGAVPEEGTGRRSWLVNAVLFGVLVVAASLLPPARDVADRIGTGEGGLGPLLPEVGVQEATARLSAAPSVFAALLLGVVALVLIVALARRRRSVRTPYEVESLGAAVDRATQRALAADDPRSGVLVAFATLEEAFAAAGAPRSRGETQSAWVERLLVEQGAVPGPARRLRDAFETARFATAAVTEADHAAALADLAALRPRPAVR